MADQLIQKMTGGKLNINKIHHIFRNHVNHLFNIYDQTTADNNFKRAWNMVKVKNITLQNDYYQIQSERRSNCSANQEYGSGGFIANCSQTLLDVTINRSQIHSII